MTDHVQAVHDFISKHPKAVELRMMIQANVNGHGFIPSGTRRAVCDEVLKHLFRGDKAKREIINQVITEIEVVLQRNRAEEEEAAAENEAYWAAQEAAYAAKKQ